MKVEKIEKILKGVIGAICSLSIMIIVMVSYIILAVMELIIASIMIPVSSIIESIENNTPLSASLLRYTEQYFNSFKKIFYDLF